MVSNHESDNEFVRKHAPGVYNLALRLTGNPHDAEDLAQDALIQAVKGLETFRGESSPATWVYRIVMNVWKNQLRAKSRKKFLKFLSLELFTGRESDQQQELAGLDHPADKGMESAEESQALQEALMKLDAEDRAIFIMKKTQDMKYKDIAEALNIPEGTVKSRLSRAREALREALSLKIGGNS